MKHFKTFLIIAVFICICDAKQAIGLQVHTDKENYDCKETVNINVNNNTNDKFYIFLGPCNFKIEEFTNRNWFTTEYPWSSCSSCGVFRELPSPIFLKPNSSKSYEWDKTLAFCSSNEKIKNITVSGLFRFVLYYIEDKNKCISSINPYSCWESDDYDNWDIAYSNEFNVLTSDCK